MMGAVFVDDERSTAWIGTWHELGSCESAEAVGRALFERVSDALLLSCLEHADASDSGPPRAEAEETRPARHCDSRPATLFVGVGLPKDSAAEALVRAAGYQLVEDVQGAGR